EDAGPLGETLDAGRREAEVGDQGPARDPAERPVAGGVEGAEVRPLVRPSPERSRPVGAGRRIVGGGCGVGARAQPCFALVAQSLLGYSLITRRSICRERFAASSAGTTWKPLPAP